MQEIIKVYIEEFNSCDDECYTETIPNKDAYAWINNHVPVFECPDKLIEKVYYYRWWVYRKHIRCTPCGYIITEFMPDVPWAGNYNSINAPAALHIEEGRWLRDNEKYIENYIRFWIDGKGDAYSYSSWLIYSIWEYCRTKNDYSVAAENIDKLCIYYKNIEKKHLCDNGMFWSVDDRDGMEYSISGTTNGLKPIKGFRPTLNSYMAADAYALSEIARIAKKYDIQIEYKNKYENLKKLIFDNLWDGDFFKAKHCTGKNGEPILAAPCPDMDVRELIGYIPWYFNLAPAGCENAFKYLNDENGFKSDVGLMTAQRCHKRFMYTADHECLWNGYVWPYATSLTITAAANLLRGYRQNVIDKNDLYSMISTYAGSHKRKKDDGTEIMWIDEVLDPVTGEWSSREILRKMGFPKELGGYERGKDYNHSTFCNLIFEGLLGISVGEDGKVDIDPLIPDDWDYFMVDNIELGGKRLLITYDKDGKRYNRGKGIVISEK